MGITLQSVRRDDWRGEVKRLRKRRSKLGITLTVLNAINDGVTKPTRIMYVANMSWRPFQEILTNLAEQGLVNKTVISGNKRSARRYTITEKGVEVIEYYKDMKDLVGDMI